MRRKNKDFKVDLIFCADLHLMEKDRNPPCRLDSHWDAQWDKINQIKQLLQQYGCDLVCSGDLFEHWKPSPYLINKCIDTLPGGETTYSQFRTVIGNHDMPQHNLENMDKSGLMTLKKAGKIYVLDGTHWGQPLDASLGTFTYRRKTKRKIVIAHMMTWQGTKPWPGCIDPEADEVFDIFPNADLIVTGHNHKTFTAKRGNQLLINPGSLTRHKADQIDHKPCVFLWNDETNTCKPHYLKIKEGVISREHIDVKKEKAMRMTAFIEKLKTEWDVSISFRDNMERVIKKNKVPKKIQQIIYKWMGE